LVLVLINVQMSVQKDGPDSSQKSQDFHSTFILSSPKFRLRQSRARLAQNLARGRGRLEDQAAVLVLIRTSIALPPASDERHSVDLRRLQPANAIITHDDAAGGRILTHYCGADGFADQKKAITARSGWIFATPRLLRPW
jgi:hypothetical protein